MEKLSLLTTLLQDSKKDEPVLESTEKAETVKYQVYVIEQNDVSRRVGIPLDSVDAFDAVLSESPEKLSEIEDILKTFSAVILD
jgi:hypothetical protein